MNYISTIEASWEDSDIVCALATRERHLGHVTKEGLWYAWDATHVDEASHGFRCVGSFPDLASAKQIVELAVWRDEDCAGKQPARRVQ